MTMCFESEFGSQFHPCRPARPAGPDTGVDTIQKVEGPGPLGGPGGLEPSKGRRRKMKEKRENGEKKTAQGQYTTQNRNSKAYY